MYNFPLQLHCGNTSEDQSKESRQRSFFSQPTTTVFMAGSTAVPSQVIATTSSAIMEPTPSSVMAAVAASTMKPILTPVTPSEVTPTLGKYIF